MNSKSLFVLVPLVACCLNSNGQQAKVLTFHWELRGGPVNAATVTNIIDAKPFFLVGSESENANAPFNSLPDKFTYTLPKGAIFCRMENAVYEKFNLLFKIRMGNNGCSD